MTVAVPEKSKVVVAEDAIKARVSELGRDIHEDYKGKSLLMIGVLRGAALFLADLIREIHLPLSIDFMAVSSYGASTRSSGAVRILKDLDEEIEGRHVILVEDIVDTGLTLNYLLQNLSSRMPQSLEVCTLLLKKGKQQVPVRLKYVGFEIPDEFVVGYGLDVGQRYRNLPFVAGLPESAG